MVMLRESLRESLIGRAIIRTALRDLEELSEVDVAIVVQGLQV